MHFLHGGYLAHVQLQEEPVHAIQMAVFMISVCESTRYLSLLHGLMLYSPNWSQKARFQTPGASILAPTPPLATGGYKATNSDGEHGSGQVSNSDTGELPSQETMGRTVESQILCNRSRSGSAVHQFIVQMCTCISHASVVPRGPPGRPAPPGANQWPQESSRICPQTES